ncbi:MAG: MFS transporter [Bacteroidales bacterium]|nr:MFS transporter [Bacteroidales bacterium]
MQDSKKFQTGKILIISFAHLLHDIYTSFLAPLRPLLIDKLDISLSMSSLLDIFQRIPFLLSPILGIIADKTQVRYFVIFTPAITAVLMSLLGVAPSFIILVILLFVVGISSALFHVPTPVMIKKVAGNKTGKGMSFYMLGGEIARTLGPLVITGAVSLWGLEGTYKLIPFGIIASLILYVKLRKIKISDDFKRKNKQIGIKQTFIKLLPFFIILACITFFRAIMKSGLTAFLPTYFFNEKGETLWFANSALAVLQLAGAAGTYFSGTLSDKIGRKTTLLIIIILTPIFVWFFVNTEGLLSILILILTGFFLFAPGPILLALVQDVAHERPAFINGIYMTMIFLVGSLSVVLTGILGDWIGLEKTYLISAFIALGAIPFVLMLKTK